MQKTSSTRGLIVLHDLAMVMVAWLLAWVARFNFDLPPPLDVETCLRSLPVVLAIQVAWLWRSRLYRSLWRFASLRDLSNIVTSAVLGALCSALALFVINRLEGVPRSVLLLYPVLLIFCLGGPRFAWRMLKERRLSLTGLEGGQRVLIVGAGAAAEMLLRDMLREGTSSPVGLVDDRAGIERMRIHGVPVLGTVEDVPRLAAELDVDLLVIAIPSASNEQMQRIVGSCEQAGRPFRTLPRLQDIVAGRAGQGELREVAIEDLLGRSAVALDWDAIQRRLAGQVILVTGGGGSIGSELCRQLASMGVARLVILERNEHNLYLIERELRASFPHLALDALLGDVCDERGLGHVFARFRPRLVFHAAAYKHVPIVEAQIREGLRNNVLGTAAVADAAARSGAEAMVLISTDKAVRPSSVMGATKRFAEMVCERRAQSSPATRFVTVRFGNVLGSAGSVVPLFREQIARGGPITVTHADATRYFMTIPEAGQLILQAAAVGRGGDIFVLDMGQPVNITYLAEQMIRLSGKRPGSDIRIVYTGLRPGEKLREELFHEEENLRATPHPKLLLAGQDRIEGAMVDDLLWQMRLGCERYDEARLKKLLIDAVPALAGADAPRESTVVPFKRNSP